MGNLQRGVPDLPGLLAEDGPEQPFLRSELGLSLGGDLAHQIVAGANLRADADDAVLVQVLQRILAHVGDVPGDLLGAQLGIPGFGPMLFNVNGGKHVLPDQALVQENGVLIIIALPGDEADEHILAQGNFPLGAGRTVGNVCSG